MPDPGRVIPKISWLAAARYAWGVESSSEKLDDGSSV
jgi:hypothetical protein